MSTSLPTNPSESTKRRNPSLYRPCPPDRDDMMWKEDEQVCQDASKRRAKAPVAHPVTQKVSEQPKRIRQRVKPLMNKLEQRFFDSLGPTTKQVYAQSITFLIANGVRYTPDVFCFDWVWQSVVRPVAWEVKGKWMTDDAVVKLKMFAAKYPHILVLLVWEDKATGQWLNQIVYP